MNIPFHRPFVGKEEEKELLDALANGWITMGIKTIKFEEKFRQYIGSTHAVAVSSCTAALHLALRVVGLEEGDEVLVPAITFVATAEVVNYFKVRPVFVDVDPNTGLIDIKDLAKKITDKTKVIIPVHYSGQPCDMDEILEIARERNLFVIEDAAHALPAWYKGKKIGTIGDITAFSFYATKTLATGEGGMATTENEDWAEKMRILRLHGISKDAWKRYTKEGSWEYDVLDNGYKYNMTDLNAALGLAQLRKLEKMWQKRVNIAEKYHEAFSQFEALIPYPVKSDRVSSWHLYPLRLNLNVLSIDRNRFIDELKKRGISVSVHFIPLYRFSYYRKYLGDVLSAFPGSEKFFQSEISLPIYPSMTDEEVYYVIENVIDVAKENMR